MKPLRWVDDPSTTPDALLKRLQQYAGHLLHTDSARNRGPDFDPLWKKRRGYVDADAPLENTDKNRADFNRVVASDALMQGLRIAEMPWGAGWMCICAGMAKWGQAALLHILELEHELAAAEAERDTNAAKLEQLRRAHTADRAWAAAEHGAALAQVEHAHACERARADAAETEVRRLGEERQRRTEAEAQVAALSATAEAWRTAAQATQRALEVLRVAAGIHVQEELPDGPRRLP